MCVDASRRICVTTSGYVKARQLRPVEDSSHLSYGTGGIATLTQAGSGGWDLSKY